MSEETPRFRRPWEEPEPDRRAERPTEPEAPDGPPAEPERPAEERAEPEEPVEEPAEPEGPADREAPAEQRAEPERPAEQPADPDRRGPDQPSDVDLTDWEEMALTPSSLDAYDREAYTAATTEEYRGLAAEIARLREENFDNQAVSATMAGVGTGLVGFEDVTGHRGLTEEEVEAAEQARSSDLTLRIVSAVILVGFFAASLYLGGIWFTGFLALVAMVALGEFYATVRRVGYNPLALVGLLAVLAMPLVASGGSITGVAGVAVTATVAVILVFTLVSRRHPLENASVTVFGMMWVALLVFAVPIAYSPHPVAYVLAVAFITAMVDIGSYFVGKGFGRRALAPRLSPNKTVEGFIGGVVAAVLTSAVISTFPPYADLGFEGSILLGVLIAVVAPVGDLAESMVKRSLGVKDMGSILPGHGGMLDRLDGFLFAVPAAYVLLFVLGLI